MLDKVKGWLGQPFSENMDAWQWAIFTFFIVTLAVIWFSILDHVIGD